MSPSLNIYWRPSINEQDIHDQSSRALRFGPFSPQTDRSYYYSVSSFEQRLHVLQRLVQGKDFLILVIGEFGSGKTVLLNRFLDVSDENWRTCQIKTRVSVPAAESPQADNVKYHPAYILQENQIPIILFDDAHCLTSTELKYIFQNALTPDSQRKLKRLVLFCEPQILATMENLTKAISSTTVINKIYMPPLTQAETAVYLWHRLTAAGFRGKNPFKAPIVKKIHKASGGLPGRINEEANKHLKGPKSPVRLALGIVRIKGFNPKRFWGWVGGSIVVFVLAFLVMGPLHILQLFSPKQQAPSNAAQILKKKIEKSAMPQIRAEDSIKPEQKDKTNTAASPPETKTQNIRPELKLKLQKGPENATITHKKNTESASRIAETAQKPIYREKWLLQQNPAFYTIQIIGLKNEKELHKYIQTNFSKHQEPIAYYQTRFKGNPWYPLLYGIYPSREKALSAVQKLPNDVQKLSPWIRKLSSVHNSIRKNMKP